MQTNRHPCIIRNEKKVRGFPDAKFILSVAMPDWVQNPSGNTTIWESGALYHKPIDQKKLEERRKEALDTQGFKRVLDDKPVDITKLPEDDKGLYYKDELGIPQKKAAQRLI